MKKQILLCMLGALVCSAGARPKISADLKKNHRDALVRVIVQWTIGTGEKTNQTIAALGGSAVAEFRSVHSGVYLLPASSLDALATNSEVSFISADRKVKKRAASIGITPASINAQAAFSSNYTGQGIGVAILDSGINQDDDLGLYFHAPVYTEDFTAPVTIQPDGKPGPKPASYGLDWFGHGQHIAGIIASNGKTSTCATCSQVLAGIAPGVKLINLKVLDTSGEGADSFVIAAIDRAIALKSTYNIRVMNLSLGRPVFESYLQDPLCQAVEAAWQAGITVVVSAGNDGRNDDFGNDGYATINAPGNDPYVITVGAMRSMGTATRSDDLIASYSSKGPTAVDHIVKPDIVAPGNQVISLLAQHGTLPLANPQNVAPLSAFQMTSPKLDSFPVQPTYNSDSDTQPPALKIPSGYSKQYYVLNGTSMASAVVSGAVADLLQANPALTPDQVKVLLMRSASKSFPTMSTVYEPTTGKSYVSYYDIFTVGAGYVDLQAALTLIRQTPSGLTAMSPTAVYDALTGDVEISYNPSSVFSDKAMWGTDSVSANKALWGVNSVWGASVLCGNKALWGVDTVWSASNEENAQKAMWGTDSLSANKALWGTGAIWSNSSVWSTNSSTTSQSIMITGEP